MTNAAGTTDGSSHESRVTTHDSRRSPLDPWSFARDLPTLTPDAPPDPRRDDRNLRRIVSLLLAARRTTAALALLSLAALAACAHGGGAFVWADRYQAAPAPAYTVGVGDLLDVRVWDNDRLSARARVRDDGRISVPLLTDLAVVGQTPAEVARLVESRLVSDSIVLKPRVTVGGGEVKAQTVAVLGAVTRPGTYSVEHGGVAEALASAGGLTEFAHRDRIYVVRRSPAPTRIRFTFASLTRAGGEALFQLRAGDVVVAE